MLSVFTLIFPIFALIFLGWYLRKRDLLNDSATTQLNKFVVWLALPALLFDITATSAIASLWQPGFVLSFTLAVFVIFALTVVVQKKRNMSLSESAIDGLNTSYANTGFMGFPLLMAVAGSDTQAPVLIATIITVCVLFAVAIVLIEIDLSKAVSLRSLIADVSVKLLKNPVVIAPLAGVMFPAFDIDPPQPLLTTASLLGHAAAPCALVTIGLFIAGSHTSTKGSSASVISFVITKLLVHPALAYVIAMLIMPDNATGIFYVVLLSALPAGTGPFMLAEYYQKEAGKVSASILITTVMSPFTLGVIIYLFQ